jgi:RNA ligase (TIGR02306 family)
MKLENELSCCYIARISEIRSIEGADNIEQAMIGGWSCIVKKHTHSVGELIVCATTDAVIPVDLSDSLEITNYLRKGQRVRTVKLRGVYSECLLIPLEYLPNPSIYQEGNDVMDILDIHKYEPPVKQIKLASGKKIRYQDNPNFTVYYKFPNAKNVPNMFDSGDIVQITRKIHGTNSRYSIVKKIKLKFWDKVKKFFGLTDEWIEYTYVYGSHNVEKGSDAQGYYSTDVWREIAEKYEIREKLWKYVKEYYTPETLGSGIIVYGEIYGPGIQKNYDYGLPELKFSIFDITINNSYLPTNDVFIASEIDLSLPHVEILYVGSWSKEMQDKYVINNFIPGTKVPEEGIVVKSMTGERNKINKVINPEYLIFAEKHNVSDSH